MHWSPHLQKVPPDKPLCALGHPSMAATSWVKLATTIRRIVALKTLAPIAILTVYEVDTISVKAKEQIQYQ